jgi:uncharacterized protein
MSINPFVHFTNSVKLKDRIVSLGNCTMKIFGLSADKEDNWGKMRNFATREIICAAAILFFAQPAFAGVLDQLKRDLDSTVKGIERQLQNQQRPPQTNQSGAQSVRPTSANGQNHVENKFLPRGSVSACSEFSINSFNLTRQLLEAGYELDGPSPFRTIDDQSRRLESEIAEASTNADDNFNVEDEAGNCARGLAQLAKDNWDAYSRHRKIAAQKKQAKIEQQERREKEVLEAERMRKVKQEQAKIKRQQREEQARVDAEREQEEKLRRKEEARVSAERAQRAADKERAAKKERKRAALRAKVKIDQAHRAIEKGDYDKAVLLISDLAIDGNATAQYELALLYEVGKGVGKSEEEAVNWFSEAADQGNKQAQHKLGSYYARGIGVEESQKSAFSWYLKAAKKGHLLAQVEIAHMYFQGKGVKQNRSEAEQWYIKTAKRGHDGSAAKLLELAELRKEAGREAEIERRRVSEFWKKAELVRKRKEEERLRSVKLAKRKREEEERRVFKRLTSKTRRLSCFSERTGKNLRWTMERGGNLYMNGDLVPNNMWEFQGTDVIVSVVGETTVNFLERESSSTVYGMKTLFQCY